MTTQEVIKKAAVELNLPYKRVWEIYQAYWESIREYISSLLLKECESEEEFSKIRANVNISSLGKFHIDWERLTNKKEENERIKNKKTKTYIYDSIDNT